MRMSTISHRRILPALAVMGALVAGCGGDDASSTTPPAESSIEQPVIDPGDAGDYSPTIDPSEFTTSIDHPYLPLSPGSRWVYESRGGDETEVITVEVLDETRMVMGVETVVVHDVVTVDDEVIEDTYDWYAQDGDGNVWYFGEDTTSYDEGVASSEGAWEAGVDGALPGIVMPADPAVTGVGYRQEYYPGEAEDMGEVIATSGSASTPAGEFADVIVTRDWTPLEPDVVEEKTYARDVGLVLEVKTTGDEESVELVDFWIA